MRLPTNELLFVFAAKNSLKMVYGNSKNNKIRAAPIKIVFKSQIVCDFEAAAAAAAEYNSNATEQQK